MRRWTNGPFRFRDTPPNFDGVVVHRYNDLSEKERERVNLLEETGLSWAVAVNLVIAERSKK